MIETLFLCRMKLHKNKVYGKKFKNKNKQLFWCVYTMNAHSSTTPIKFVLIFISLCSLNEY